ncbi:hypothetical protein [Soonwooa sp.]|uniref:hypothetical protein n=1 Tax=Soonwooa sp. TaxID=1938592 RepID=UPI002898D3F3|nr:hypothetical protein [Soonwooa sp.]
MQNLNSTKQISTISLHKAMPIVEWWVWVVVWWVLTNKKRIEDCSPMRFTKLTINFN